MKEEVKKDILRVLKESIIAIKEGDMIKLKDLSNSVIENSIIYQDENAIIITILIYSLSKIFERSKLTQYKDWNLFKKTVDNSLKKAAYSLENNDLLNYEKSIKEILSVINNLESKLKDYIRDIFYRAHINKASRLYEHGLSIGRTAELLGITKWDLMDYIGRTGIPDVKENITLNIEKRLRIARSLFR